MNDNNSFQTKWNFDEDRCKELNDYLVLCNGAIISWELENAYLYLEGIDNITHGILTEAEAKVSDGLFEEIEGIRRDYFNANKNNMEVTIKLRKKIKELFKKMNEHHVKHELYFRKKEGFEGL